MYQTFERGVSGTLPENSNRLERGIHGYLPFPGIQSRTEPRFAADEYSDELDTLEELIDSLTDENIDEAIPRLARIAARALARPLLQTSGRRLSRPLYRQLVRSTGQAARTLVRRQGRAGLRALPRIVQSVRRNAVRHRLPVQTLPQAMRRITPRVAAAAHPTSLRRLAQSPANPQFPCPNPAQQNRLCHGQAITHGGSEHRRRIKRIVDRMCQQGWCDIRVNLGMTTQQGTRYRNRPDVSGINPRTGQRVHVEIDSRQRSSQAHETTITQRDPSAVSTYVVIDPQTRSTVQGRTHKPARR